MPESESITYDLAIIGTGMAGMAAGLFAANRGLSIAQIGGTKEIIFASGLFVFKWAFIQQKQGICGKTPGQPSMPLSGICQAIPMPV